MKLKMTLSQGDEGKVDEVTSGHCCPMSHGRGKTSRASVIARLQDLE